MPSSVSRVPELLSKYESDLLREWVTAQSGNGGRRLSAAEERQLTTESRDFLGALREATQSGNVDIDSRQWSHVRELLTELSASRARSGQKPVETATFVFSLKEPVFALLRRELANEPQALADETWATNVLLDKLGLFTTEVAQSNRDEIIARQQQELLELSTPVVRLWDNVLALPLIGTLDSGRTQIVMQNLLQAIVETRSDIAIIDITGVPTVDTLVAQHLLKTVAAARLMGADCIISGIRPQIAQTIIHLGVDLAEVTTKATLADAFLLALQRTGFAITRVGTGQAGAGR